MKDQFDLSGSYFETSDLLLAAIIQLQGIPIAGIDWRDGERCSFSFKDSSALKKLIHTFWQRELSVEPQALFAIIKSTKTRLYSSR